MPPLKRQWRSLEHWARDPALLARAAKEFPALADALNAPRDRRQVLKLMAAAFALAGLGGCDDGEPDGTLIPPVLPDNEAVGQNSIFATANVLAGYADGVLVTHRAGRPIKVEGNPDHPASLGATDAFAQAAILDFYDPDRASAITENGNVSDWSSLLTALAAERARLSENHGAGLRIVTGAVTSPALTAQIKTVLQRYPEARWHRWEAISRDAVHAGARIAYGRAVDIVPRLSAADIILAIDSDLISSAPGHLRFARDFATRRNPTRTTSMSRVYAVEPTPSLIGAAADHRIPAGPRLLHAGIIMLADAMLRGIAAPADAPDWLRAVIADLRNARGRAFVHAGPSQPPEIHALVHAINETLGGRGTTYDVIDPIEAMVDDPHGSLSDLAHDMQAGRVTTLLIIDSNPVFTAPPHLGFAQAMQRVPLTLALTVAPNETSQLTHWSLPQLHDFETWSDARAFEGTATILQPQAQPLYGGTSPLHLLSLLVDASGANPRTVVQQTWRDHLGDNFHRRWHDALAAGIIPDSAAQPTAIALRPDAGNVRPPSPPDHPVTLLFRPDPHLWDGRFANNAWLQELPRPMTKLVWDNPLLISPQLAAAMQLANGDNVTLAADDREIVVPVWILPGQAPDCATALLGPGRSMVGSVGELAGFNFYPFTGRSGAAALRRVGTREQLACTEHHDLLVADASAFVRHGSLPDFTANPQFLAGHEAATELYRWHPPGPAAWGMSIDLNACIGCNACVVACMAENNVPVVGKPQVLREREMHWLRIDRYYEGSVENPRTFFQPMLCMHCEQAPCELVCPVGATMHDTEGLNVMVYNRCVGTRFCSNNCPYKVRRFNFYAFAGDEHRPAIARNPDVTVRARGVMEKCTFCLQRIAAARIEADAANRPVQANEVRTACQAACPTQAISFGNMAAPNADVTERKRSPLCYGLLSEQNTHPRVTYEARIVNSHASLVEDKA